MASVLIDLSNENLTFETEDDKTNPQFYARYALDKFFNSNTPKKISVRACTTDTQYPEIKEKTGRKYKPDVYILATVNLNRRWVYLEGWCSRKDLFKQKNKFKNYYLKSYKDLNDMVLLNADKSS